METRLLLQYLWKTPLGMIAWFGGLMLGGTLLPVLGLTTPVIPEGADTITVGMISLGMSVFVVFSGAFITQHLKGNFFSRWGSISLLILVAYGVNNALEGALFTNIPALATPLNLVSTIVLQVFPSFSVGAAIALLFKPPPSTPSFIASVTAFMQNRKIANVLGRLLLSVGAFVLIYWGVGVVISPLVTPFYLAGEFELVLPSLDQILLLQGIRGTLISLTLVPLIIAWKNSSSQLFLALGFALFVLLGLFPLSLAYWIAFSIRAIHTLEILVDSFLFAKVITWLLAKEPLPKESESTIN